MEAKHCNSVSSIWPATTEPRSVADVGKCYGCSACVLICHRRAISMQESNEGFYRPKVDLEKCVECGQCSAVCPSLTSFNKSLHDVCDVCILAARSKRGQLFPESSSGGIVPELADMFFKKGHMLVGARYNSVSERAEHIVARTVCDMMATGGSKYMQSYTEAAWREVVNNPGKYVIVGTPCQIAGIKRVLDKCSHDVLYVEFWCHGVPSLKLWKSFLRMLKIKGSGAVAHWRDKERFAWSNGYCVILKKNDKTLYAKSSLDGDLYSRHFLRSSCANETCVTCPFDLQHSLADIRVGDCWGARFERNGKALSKVALLSERGKQVWASLSNQIEEVELTSEERSEIARMPCGNACAPVGLERKIFIRLLDFPKGFQLAHHWHLAWSIIRRVRGAI